MERAIMSKAELVESVGVRRRRWRTVEEKRRIVEATLVEGASVSQVARLHGVNTNQVFHWRRQYNAGDLSLPVDSPTKFLPVVVSEAPESCEEIPSEEPAKRSGGAIHVEFPGRALVSIESGVDPALASAVLERLMR
jgi:transposase